MSDDAIKAWNTRQEPAGEPTDEEIREAFDSAWERNAEVGTPIGAWNAAVRWLASRPGPGNEAEALLDTLKVDLEYAREAFGASPLNGHDVAKRRMEAALTKFKGKTK